MATDAEHRMTVAMHQVKKASDDKIKTLRAKRAKVFCPHRDTLDVGPEATRKQILARRSELSLECRVLIQSAPTAELKQLAQDKLGQIEAAAQALVHNL